MISLTREDFWSLLYYLLALPLVIVAAYAVTGFTIVTINTMPRSMTTASWIGIVINVVPPLLCGATIYGGLAAWRRANHVLSGGFLAHLLRASVLYLLAFACGIILYLNWDVPDFGLWGQIPLWTGLASAGGVVADLIMSHRKDSLALDEQ